MSLEHFERWADVVETLPDAWAFVMEYVDRVVAPSVTISPLWVYGEDDPDGVLHFEVAVSGNHPGEVGGRPEA